MSGFGDEFVVESYRIPWLIWIQLLVTILLIILLFFGLSVFTLESSTSSAAAPPPPHLNNPSSSHGRPKTEIQRIRRDRVINTEFNREEVQNEESSSSKRSSSVRIFKNVNHPCNYFGLAKQALLKCLGLDSSSELSSGDQHEKQE